METNTRSKSGQGDCEEIKKRTGTEETLEDYGLLEALKRNQDELIDFCPAHDEKHYNRIETALARTLLKRTGTVFPVEPVAMFWISYLQRKT